MWGRIAPSVWWPGEALNPLHLPPGRSLPQGATSGMAALHPSLPGSLGCPVQVLIAGGCSAQLASVQALHTPGADTTA